MKKKKKHIDDFAKYQFYERVDNALKKQEVYGSSLKEDIRGIRHHGGLGWKFLTAMKVLAVAAIIAVIGLWVYVYVARPQFANAYSVSMVVIGITLSVLYWRKVTDDQLL